MKLIIRKMQLAFVLSLMAMPVAAQDFYSGKIVRFNVTSAAGTSYDTFARTTVRHLERYIPGNPRVIVQNMPGAGGLVGTNHLYNIAEKDGTFFTMINRNAILQPIVGNKQARFKSADFYWLGTPATYRDEPYVFVLHANKPYKTAAELRNAPTPVNIGNSGSVMVRLLNEALGLNVKIVEGYEKTALDLAFERGEVDGMGVGYTNLNARFPAQVEKKAITVLVQFGSEERSPALPDVPTARELAISPTARALLEFIEAPLSIAYPIALPPGVPADRAALMRKAFQAAWTDVGYKADIEKQRLSYSPKFGERVQAEVASLSSASKEVVDRYLELAPSGGD